MPWRVEQWLSRRALVQRIQARRLARWDRRLYADHVRPGDLVFDVGANRGDKTAVFLGLGARVLAIEPDPRTADGLRRRFRGEPRTTVLDMGVGAASGEMPFHPSSYSTRSTFAVDRMRQLGDNVEYGAGTIVSVTTLDALIAAHGVPRFCKIDVEGYEPEVLRGLSQPVPVLSFEFHGELMDDARNCLERLNRLGMTRFNVVLHPIGGHRHQPLDRLYLAQHVTRDDLVETLAEHARHHRLAGDIWAFSQRTAPA